MREYQKMIEKRIEFLTGNGEGSLEIIEFYNKTIFNIQLIFLDRKLNIHKKKRL